MASIRRAETSDASRIAEILIFTKRMTYRPIFQNDLVSFGDMQVLPLANAYLMEPAKLEHIWVYDDEFVKGMLHVAHREIKELYVEPFFQNQGIGAKLMTFAIGELDADHLWVLEKNRRAVRFYQSHGFTVTHARMLEEGTAEYIIKMKR